MTAYKITVEVEVKMDGTEAADDLGLAIASTVDAMVDHFPTVSRYDGIIDYNVTEVGAGASFVTSVSEYGNSLAVNVTKQAREVGIRKGDKVAVIVRRLA